MKTKNDFTHPISRAYRYSILQPLTTGGQSRLWLAEDRLTGKVVVIKSGTSENDLRREFRMLKRLRHPHIPRVYDIGVFQDENGLVLEAVEGETLAQLINQNHVFTQNIFWRLVFQLLLTLDYLGRLRIVHRDLKPQNILIGGLLSPLPSLKLIDFGMAEHEEDLGEQKTPGGTIQYTAPEVIKKSGWDIRSDIYSLGVILYEWISGINPFDAESVVQVVVRHLEENPPAPKCRIGNIPDDFISVMMKCLSKNPDLRYQNAGEILKDLLRIPVIREAWKDFPMVSYVNERWFVSESDIANIINHVETLQKSSSLTVFRITTDHQSDLHLWADELNLGLIGNDLHPLFLQTEPNRSGWYHLQQLAKALTMEHGYTEESKVLENELEENLNTDEWINQLLFLAENNPVPVWIFSQAFQLSAPEKEVLRHWAQMQETKPLVLIELIPAGAESLFDTAHHEYRISGLHPDHIHDSLREMLLGIPAEESLSDYLRQTAGTDTQFLTETVRYLLHKKNLIFNGQQYDFICPVEEERPTSVQELLSARLSGLSEEDRRFLILLSLYPGEWRLEDLSAVFSIDIPVVRLNEWEHSGYIRRSPSGIAINGEFLRSRLYHYLTPEEKLQKHRQLADYYERKDPTHAAPAIAHHLLQSGQSDRAIPYFLNAAEQYHASGQWNMAFDALDRVYHLLKPTDPAERWVPVLELLVTVCDLLAERGHQRKYLNEWERWTNQTGPEERLRYYLARANYLERISAYADMEQVLGEAAVYADQYIPQKRYAVYRLLGKSYYQRARWQDALVAYQRALAEAPPDLPVPVQIDLFNGIGTVYGTLGQWEQALQAFERVYESAVRSGDIRAQVNALLNLGFLSHRLRQDARAISYYNQTEELIRPLRNRKYEQRLRQYQGISYRNLNQPEKALECFERAETISRNIHDLQTLGKSLAEQAFVYQRLGASERALERIEEAIRIARRLNHARDVTVRLLRKADMLMERLQIADAASVIREAQFPFDQPFDPEWEVYAGWLTARCQWLTEPSLSVKDTDILQRLQYWIEKAQARRFHSLLVLLYDLAAEMLLHAGDKETALTLSEKAVRLVEQNEICEFDEIPALLRYYHILRLNNTGREKSGPVIEKIIRLIQTTEQSLNRSDLREYYHFKASVVEAREAYQRFLDEEQRFHIESFPVLFEIAQAINSVLDPDTLFERILDEVLRHTGADRGVILLWDEQTEQFEIRAARQSHPEEKTALEQISQSVVRDVYQTGKPVVTADAQQDDRFREHRSILAYHIRSVMCVPLKIRDRLVGAVYVDKQFDADYFSRANVEFLELFAHLAALAIENARLYAQIREEKESLRKQNIDLRLLAENKYQVHRIVGRSKPLREVIRLIELASGNNAPVVIEGESGTGKELVARAIHFNSPRKNKSFVAVDCGSLQESLLESELFGHKKGAFTGAVTDKKGLFEEAEGGTLFLDEITNTSLNFQSKLLRVLQEGEIRRLGDTKTRTVDVRVIAATNRKLTEEVRRSAFREDLYFRLNVFRIHVPALRERRDDIPILIRHFVDHFNSVHNKNIETIAPALLDRLMRYDWPGNVRELENLIQRMVILASDSTLTTLLLPEEMQTQLPLPEPAASDERPFFHSLREMENYLYEIEKNYWLQVLHRAGGNKSKAAENLGIKRTTLNDRLKKFGLL